jgi:hypothetical protein
MVSPSMTLAGPVRQSVRRLNVKIARRPVARRPSIQYAARSVAEHRRVGLPLRVLRQIRSKFAYAESTPPEGG